MSLVRLGRPDLRFCTAAAALHIREIHHGLLPLLGERFLAQLYLAIAQAPRSGVWAVIDADRLTGFIAGCADVGKTYQWLLVHRLPRLAFAAGLALFRFSVLRKIPSVLFYPFTAEARTATTAEPAAKAELLAIAVERDQQGKGTGKRLLVAFEEALREWDVREYRVQTNVVEQQSNAFYRRAGFEPAGTRPHHALVLQTYLKSLGA